MYIYTQEGRKEHILIEQGRVVKAGKLILAAKHKNGVTNATAGSVTIRPVGKDNTDRSDSPLVNLHKLNISSDCDTKAVVTVIDFPYSSLDYVGITIQITDDDNMVKSISDVHIGWTSMPILESGINNTGVVGDYNGDAIADEEAPPSGTT